MARKAKKKGEFGRKERESGIQGSKQPGERELSPIELATDLESNFLARRSFEENKRKHARTMPI